jgi:hypothetical protein
MIQETFEDFKRSVSYTVERLPNTPLSFEPYYLKCAVLRPYGLLVNLRPLTIVEVLSDEQKADYLIMKARQGERRLWEALQNREVRGAE